MQLGEKRHDSSFLIEKREQAGPLCCRGQDSTPQAPAAHSKFRYKSVGASPLGRPVPKEVVEPPFLEMLRLRLGRYLSGTAEEQQISCQGLDQLTLEGLPGFHF